jgi:hypothetical protein
MASLNEKEPTPPTQLHLKTPVVTTKSSHETFESEGVTPTAEKRGSRDLDRRGSEASCPCSNQLNPFDTDIEAIITPATTTGELCDRKSTACARGGTDCHVWPGRSHWKRKAKIAKKKRSPGCLSHLNKRNRLLVKILIGFLIVGIAVGVGFGISKPLGAGIWKPREGAQT